MDSSDDLMATRAKSGIRGLSSRRFDKCVFSCICEMEELTKNAAISGTNRTRDIARSLVRRDLDILVMKFITQWQIKLLRLLSELIVPRAMVTIFLQKIGEVMVQNR